MNFKYPELLGIEPSKKNDDQLSWQTAFAVAILLVFLLFALFYGAAHHNIDVEQAPGLAITEDETTTVSAVTKTRGDVSMTMPSMVTVNDVSEEEATVPTPVINAGVGKVE